MSEGQYEAMKSNMLNAVRLILAGLGLAVSGYLFARTLQLYAGNATSGSICSALLGIDCDATLLSASSWFQGVPVAGWGVVYFSHLGVLVILGALLGSPFARATNITFFLVGLAGSTISVLLLIQLFTGATSLCLLCVVTHLLNFGLLAVAFLAAPGPPAEFACSLRNGIAFAIRGQAGAGSDARWSALALATAALATLAAYLWVDAQTQRIVIAADAPVDGFKLYRSYSLFPKHDIVVRDDDPRKGLPTAPVEVVVFSDFQCPGCAAIARTLDGLYERFPDSLTVVFKNYPLSTECHPELGKDVHPDACAFARAAEAARMQGKFWEFHDLIFQSDERRGREEILGIAQRLDLDLAQFQTDLSSDLLATRLENDLLQGIALQVPGTPGIFIDGRMLFQPTPNSLETLIGILVLSHAQWSG